MRAIIISFLLLLTSQSFAQTHQAFPLRGARVFSYPNGSILVQYDGQSKWFVPMENSVPAQPPNAPTGPLSECTSERGQPDLMADSKLVRQTLTPSRQAGGAVHLLNLPTQVRLKKVQIKVLSGVVEVRSAALVTSSETQRNLPELVVSRLCPGQSIEMDANEYSARQIGFRLEGYMENTKVLISYQHDTAEQSQIVYQQPGIVIRY